MHRKLWYEYQLPKNTASSIQHGEIAATAPSGSQPQQVARNIEPFLADAFDHKAARRIPTRHDSALLPRVPRLGKTGQSEGKRFIDSIADCFSTAVKSVLLAQRRLMVEANYENAQLRTEGSAWRHAALANRQATFLPGGGEALRLRLSIGSLVIPTMATLELSLPKLARGPVSPTPKRAKVRRILSEPASTSRCILRCRRITPSCTVFGIKSLSPPIWNREYKRSSRCLPLPKPSAKNLNSTSLTVLLL